MDHGDRRGISEEPETAERNRPASGGDHGLEDASIFLSDDDRRGTD